MKLLVFEVDDKGNALTAPHPVPSAEELGRAAIDKYYTSGDAEITGNAIIERIRRKP